MDGLSHDANRLIAVMYREYLKRRANSASQVLAQRFSSSRFMFDTFYCHGTYTALDDALKELDRAGYLDVYYASSGCFNVYLSEGGVTRLEEQFPNGIAQLDGVIASLAWPPFYHQTVAVCSLFPDWMAQQKRNAPVGCVPLSV